MTVPLGVPVKIGDADVRLGFWGMPRNPGDPRRVAGTFTIINGEGDLLLDAFIGPKGDPGENAPIFDWQYDSTVTNIGDLPDVDTLDETDDGRAWLIGTTWYVYVDEADEYKAVEAGIPGPQGATPDIDITASFRPTVDPDDDEINVVPSGTIGSPNFEIVFPSEHLRGPEGPSTAIRLAPDYDDTIPPLDGQGIVWDEEDERYRPGDLSPMSATMHTIPHSLFTDYEGGATRQLIAALDLEALPYAWYPDVSGHIRWQRTGFLSSAAVRVEIRIGDTGVGDGSTADLCGLAPYDPTVALFDSITIAYIGAQFSDTDDPGRAVSPISSEGRVPAGQAKTIYVFLHKQGGSGNYKFTKSNVAQVKVLQYPVS